MDKTTLSPHLVERILGERIVTPGMELIWADAPEPYQQALVDAIARLPVRLQDIIAARFGERIGYAEYGRRLGRSRERVRQLEAQALRRLRLFLKGRIDWLQNAITTQVIINGPLDPAWITVKEAARITGLSPDHLRRLGKQGKIIMRRHPANGRYRQISRVSLKGYILAQPADGRHKGQWKEDTK